MKKSINKLQVIPATIYPSNVYIFRGFDYENAQPHLEAIEEECLFLFKEAFNHPGYTVLTPNGSVVVFIEDDTNIPMFVHELFHAVEFILQRVDIQLTKDTSEVYAYLLQYMVEQIMT